MAHEPATPFDSIEGALEYVGLLGEAVREASGGIVEDVELARAEGAARRLEALHVVGYKLDRLGEHVAASRRLLNDLRTLRRLLLRERADASEPQPAKSASLAPRPREAERPVD